jgi:predicted peptidase
MKKTNSLKTALLVAGIAAANCLSAQTTGSFDTTITFMGAPRTMSLFVPTTYSPATSYRLIIGLHGLGDNSPNYRNALISGLAWGTNIPNTIFVCPEAFNVNQDYFYPAGDEAIIQASITLARARYNIDTTNIVLQGLLNNILNS